MKNFTKIMTGAAGLAAIATFAAPAAAQGYPYPGTAYPNNNGGVLGAIVNGVLGGGYGQYPQGNYGYGQVNERAAVSQCAAVAEQRLNNRGQGNYGYGNQGYGNQGYGNQGYGYGNNGYNNGRPMGRVLGITNVDRRSNGKLRVTGVASSGRYGVQGGYNGGYQGGYNNGYQNNGYANQAADLRFTCKVSLRGQVTDLQFNRIQSGAYYRGY